MNGHGDNPLYRPAAVRARAVRPHGEVVLATPIPLSIACWTAVALAAAGITFALTASYTKKARVSGIVEPREGLVRIIAPASGTIVAKLVREGQAVHAGDELFVVSTDRMVHADSVAATTASVGEAVESELRKKLESIAEERRQMANLRNEQETALQKKIASLSGETGNLASETAAQQRRVALAAETLDQYRELRKSGYVADAALKQREDQYLDQSGRLQALKRSQAVQQRELDDALHELQEAPRRHRAQLATLDREEFSIRRELGENAARKAFVVTSPTEGTVTAVVGEVGKVTGNAALAVIVPRNAEFEAHLYAPSQSIGFVQPGQRVLVRFLAYPYQKFGQYHGEVLHVSRTPLAALELPQGFGSANSEPLYRIAVMLRDQHIQAGGSRHPLVAGMRVEADILQDRRRIVEWAFEPIFGFVERFN